MDFYLAHRGKIEHSIALIAITIYRNKLEGGHIVFHSSAACEYSYKNAA